MSINEESTITAGIPMMGVFNNLVVFDQHVSPIVPDLASRWSWSEDGKELTFKLWQGVKWHDGKPFTAADVNDAQDIAYLWPLGPRPTRTSSVAPRGTVS